MLCRDRLLNRVFQADSHGQFRGRCRVSRRAEDAMRAGTVIRVARMVAVRALASAGPVMVAAARVRLNAVDCGYQPGGVGVETSRGQVRQGRVFEVGVDLLDDRVAAVGLVGANGVQVAGGEERVETPGAEQGALAVVAAGVEVGDAAHRQPTGSKLGGLSGAKRGERDRRLLGA